ncbi:MAG: hypothetical protein IKJ68_05685 [Clostridia bacterium]|nr:hypothetical protein [Clostridia bacterium]
MLKVGMVEQDFTPEGPSNLPGQFYRRVSGYVESAVRANIFACESKGEQLIIVSCDLNKIEETLYNRIKLLVSKKSKDIDTDKIIISATGCLTSPGYRCSESLSDEEEAQYYLPPGCKYVSACENVEYISEKDYFETLASSVADGIINAWKKRKNAYIAPEFGRAVVGHCSRVTYNDNTSKMYGNPDKATFSEIESANDTGVELLYVFDSDRRPMGVLVNVSCPAQILEHCSFISSDFWGKAREFIKEELGPRFVTVGLCGAAGCQSPRDMIRFVMPNTKDPNLVRDNVQRLRRGDPDMYSMEGAVEIGERIADTVLRRIRRAQNNMRSDVTLKNKVVRLNLPLRTVTESEKHQAEDNYNNYISQSNKKEFDGYDMAALFKYFGVMERYSYQETTDFYKADIHIARLGDIAFASFPFDMFLDYGNRIRARSYAAQTFLIQFACANGGYLPTKKAEKGDNYSAYVASGYVGHKGGDILVDEIIEEIKEFFKD